MSDSTLFQNMEILKEKFGITYREAKEVLEENDNNLIEALIYLEENSSYASCCPMKSYLWEVKKKLADLYVEGSNQRVIISRKGNVLVDIPLTAVVVSSFAFVLYPILIPIKIGGILLFDIDIKVIDKSGNIYDVNSNVKKKVSSTISTSKEKIGGIISNVDLKVTADEIKSKAVELGKKAMENFNGMVENKITNTIKEKSSSYAKFIYNVENDDMVEEFNNEDSEAQEFIEVPECDEILDNEESCDKKQETE